MVYDALGIAQDAVVMETVAMFMAAYVRMAGLDLTAAQVRFNLLL